MPKVDLTPRKRHPRDKRPARPMPFDVALRKFKKQCERAGIVQEVREREYFEKPNQKRRRKKKEAADARLANDAEYEDDGGRSRKRRREEGGSRREERSHKSKHE